ncbi:MAG: hypothetical protein ABI680_14305 [Chthoniobacteraceae bacterium]
MTTRRLHLRIAAGTLVVTMTTLAALSMIAAVTFRRVSPKFAMAHQNAAWQEARLAAEAGIDAAMGDLLRNLTGPEMGSWPGWQQDSDTGVRGLLPTTIANLTNIASSFLGIDPRGPIASSQPIFLDNLKISTPSGVPTEIDVQLWALQPSETASRSWFRIRSMATCALSPIATRAPVSFDAPLRRFSLRHVRPSLRKDDVGEAMTIRTPNVSRTVEVLVEPIRPFELALWTQESLRLGISGTWRVDSYDSRDPEKSNPDGTYPGIDSPKVQRNGNVACNKGRPPESLYGPLIKANGAPVLGQVATNGGDLPASSEHENVDGAIALDPGQIRDDFFREMNPVRRPAAGLSLPALLPGFPFLAGTESVPLTYRTGNLGALHILPPPGGVKGLVIIIVDGNINFHSPVTIPPEVTVVIYVNGNINFNDQSINANAASSKRPGNLQIYGERVGLERRTLRAHGNAAIRAAFYGPSCDIVFSGAVDWWGALAGFSFQMTGGGSGGIHYDEALGMIGPPISFRILRCVEDVRQ